MKNIYKSIILGAIGLFSHTVFAQTDNDIRNSTGSCDSTCRADKNTPIAKAGVRYQVGGCPVGFAGYIYRGSTKYKSDTWSNWETIRDECVCQPTFENSTQVCPANMQGTINVRRDWVCPNPKMGQWTSWNQVSNTCAYYYIDTQYETRPMSCPANQTGIITQSRNYQRWSDGSIRADSGWFTTANSCAYYYIDTQYESRPLSCPANQVGSISQNRNYQRWSDGSVRADSGWFTVSNTCRNTVTDKNVEGLGRGQGYGSIWNGIPGSNAIAWFSGPSGSNADVTYAGFLQGADNTRRAGYPVGSSTIRYTIKHVAANGVMCGDIILLRTTAGNYTGERRDSYAFDNFQGDQCAAIMTPIVGNANIARMYMQPENFDKLRGHIVDVSQTGGD